MNMIRNYLILMAAVMGLVLTGCSGKNEVDTSAMEKSMAGADPAVQGDLNKSLAAIKSEDYSGAMASLSSLAAQAKLTPEQKQTVDDVIAQVKKQLEMAAAKVAEEGSKAVEDGKKAVEGLIPKQ